MLSRDQQQSEYMLQIHQPAHSGRSFLPFVTDDKGIRIEGMSFQVPVNLSTEEIRDMVRELLG